MERSSGQGSEDTSQNREHVENAAENRDALAAQARRTEATTPPDLDATSRTGSSSAGRDVENAQAMREVEENTRALEEQNRRTAATAPASVDMPDTNTSSGRRSDS